MARKRPRRKATLRSTGKATEVDLRERAEALAADPAPAMPICDGGCVLFSPAKAARRAIPKVHAARDDEAKLLRYANSGNELARAFAATLLIRHAEKIPYVAELRLPTGTIPYVIRGKAKPFFLAGLQNHHDRAARLVSYYPWAKKRRMHFFSADRGVVCTGRSPVPPRDFVEEEMDELDLSPKGDAAYACEHGGAGPGRDALVLMWKTARVDVERCSECVGTDSTLMSILTHMVGPGLTKGFDVQVRLAPLRTAAGEVVPVVPALPEALKLNYLRGLVSDEALLGAAREAKLAALRAQNPGARFYVAGERSFGDDAQSFLAALAPGAVEERALRAGLERNDGPIVLDRPTVARALFDLWPQHGLAMLEAAAGGDAEMARRLHKEKVTPDEAAELVRRAGREGEGRAAVAGLPRYDRLPPNAGVADQLARVHRTGGAEAATRAANERANAGKGKGVALAFLQALGHGKGAEWRFSAAEQETAAALQPIVHALLESSGDEYDAELRRLSTQVGEGDAFRRIP